MNFATLFRLGISSYSDAFGFIKKNKWWSLFFLSVLLFLGVLLICIFFAYGGVNVFIDWLFSFELLKSFADFTKEHSWIASGFKIALFITVLFLFISLYKFLFLALAAPLFAYIAGKAHAKITGIEIPFSSAQFIADIFRGIRISIRNFVRQLFFTLILFLLSFIPIVGLLFSFLIILLDCYYFGFSMLDYSCELEKMNVKNSVSFIKKNRGLAIGNGLIVYLSFIIIPLFGILIIAPLSVIASVIAFQKIKNNEF